MDGCKPTLISSTLSAIVFTGEAALEAHALISTAVEVNLRRVAASSIASL